MAPKGDLNPGIQEYVTFYGKKDSVDMINSRILKWEIMLDYMSGPSVIIREARESESERQTGKCYDVGFENGG